MIIGRRPFQFWLSIWGILFPMTSAGHLHCQLLNVRPKLISPCPCFGWTMTFFSLLGGCQSSLLGCVCCFMYGLWIAHGLNSLEIFSCNKQLTKSSINSKNFQFITIVLIFSFEHGHMLYGKMCFILIFQCLHLHQQPPGQWLLRGYRFAWNSTSWLSH